MALLAFEFAYRIETNGPVPGSSTANGVVHTLEYAEPLNSQKLMTLQSSFLIWFEGRFPNCELLEWKAKDPPTGVVFAEFRSHLRSVLDRMEDTRRRITAHQRKHGVRNFTIVDDVD